MKYLFTILIVFYLLISFIPSTFAQKPNSQVRPSRVSPNSMGGYNYYKNGRMIGQSNRNSLGGENFYGRNPNQNYRSYPGIGGSTRYQYYRK